MIIARVENKEVKKQVMRNKFILKGEKIFIENDLSWEERKIQEKNQYSKKAERKRFRGKSKIRKGKSRSTIGVIINCLPITNHSRI